MQSDPKYGDFQAKLPFRCSPDLDGLSVEDAGSYLEFQPDNNKINLYFKGYLHNKTNVELRSVEATLKVLYDDILIHKIKFSMLPLYKGPIRPNDAVATDAILSKVSIPRSTNTQIESSSSSHNLPFNLLLQNIQNLKRSKSFGKLKIGVAKYKLSRVTLK